MAISLTVADNCDGTVTATVAGATGGGTIYSTRLTGTAVPALGWVTRGTFTGSGGAQDFAMDPGPYVFVASDTAGISNPVHLSVKDETLPVQVRVRKAVADRIRALALPGILNVYDGEAPRIDLELTPAVCVYDLDLTPRYNPRVTPRTDWGRPVKVFTHERRQIGGDGEVGEEFARWTQAMLRAFDAQLLPDIGDVCHLTVVEPGPSLSRYGRSDGEGGSGWLLVGTEFTVRAMTREVRGFGT